MPRRTEERSETGHHGLHLGEFTLPDGLDGPTEVMQAGGHRGVADKVRVEFAVPVGGVRGWPGRPRATWMLMPKASVNEDDLASAMEYNVWSTREVPGVDFVSVTQGKQRATNSDLRLCAGAANRTHD